MEVAVTTQTWRRRPTASPADARPGTTDARPGTTDSRPRTAGKQTPRRGQFAGANRPAAGSPRSGTAGSPRSSTPGTAGARPGKDGARPSTTGARPGTAEARPGTADARPGTTGARPGTDGARPGTAGARPGTADARTGTAVDAQDERKAIDNRKLHVCGYPSYAVAGDLGLAFSRFGRVRVTRMSPDYAIVEYSSVSEARRALSQASTIHVYGEFVSVRPADPSTDLHRGKDGEKRDPFAKSKQQGVIIEPAQIPLSGDFLAQTDAVLGRIRLTQEEVQALAALYQDVERALAPLWPGCTAVPFGSITTGLGIKSSDADCLLQVPPHYAVPPDRYVPMARRSLAAHPHIFSELLAIPRANTPIVKFYHLPTATACDLSFKTPLGARNSRLVAFLLHRDPRLLPVAVIIKYWAKVHNLSGSGRLSNYALTMLYIFYLQQPPLALLPPVAGLQRAAPAPCVVDHWDTGFLDDRDKLPPLNKQAAETTIAELLGGFFEFYSTFDFQKMAVTPFLGASIPKDSFKNVETLPQEYERYKCNVIGDLTYPLKYTNPFCVQDPFEQCHNVASTIGQRSAEELIAYFKFAANAYQQDKPNQHQTFLNKILLEKPVIPKPIKTPEYSFHLQPKMTISLNFDWKRIVSDCVHMIFKDILGARLVPVKDEKDLKDRERYTATMERALWRRKKYYNQARFANTEFLDRELLITEEMKNLDQPPINLKFQLRLNFGKRKRRVIITVVHIESSNPVLLKEFGVYYLSNIHSFMDKLLKPHRTNPVEAATKLISSLQVNGQESDEETSDDGQTEEAGVRVDRPAEVGVKVDRPVEVGAKVDRPADDGVDS